MESDAFDEPVNTEQTRRDEVVVGLVLKRQVREPKAVGRRNAVDRPRD